MIDNGGCRDEHKVFHFHFQSTALRKAHHLSYANSIFPSIVDPVYWVDQHPSPTPLPLLFMSLCKYWTHCVSFPYKLEPAREMSAETWWKWWEEREIQETVGKDSLSHKRAKKTSITHLPTLNVKMILGVIAAWGKNDNC